MSYNLSFLLKRYKLQIIIVVILIISFIILSLQVSYADGLTGSRIYITDSNSEIKITSGGNYIISGSSDEASITVDADSDSRVNLILNGINISSSKNAPINIQKAANVTITLVDSTDNYICDDREKSSDENVTAAIFSKSDLTITGNGSLTIDANMNDAIKSKDNLIISSGTLDITSIDDGLIGRDSLEIDGGSISINSAGDAMKTTNTDSSGSGKFIMNGGDVTAAAGNKGIASVYSVEINDGKLTIKSSVEGIEAQFVTINDGEIDIRSSDDGINISEKSDSDDEESSEPEKMPAENRTISGNEARPGGGRRPAGGGMPGGGGMPSGNGMPGGGGRPGGNGMPAGGMGGEFETINGSLTINGGILKVNSDGDGLDSNGNIYINGGYTYVSGSTNGGNAALDYNGECIMTDGVLLLSGSAGMAQNISSDSSSMTMLSASTSETLEAGETVTINDEDGNILYSFEIAKEASYLQAAVAEFSDGGSYTFNTSGGASYEASISSHSGF